MTRIGRILTSLTTAVLWFASPAHAQGVDKIVKARIPFEFTVGNKTFPAGSYSLVCTPPGFVILRDSRAHPVAVAISRSVQGYTAAATPKLDFYVVDGRHVLGRVWQEDELYGDELFRPKDERSKLAKHKAEPAQVAASGTQP